MWNVVLAVEGLPPVAKQDVQFIVDDLSDLVKRYCGGEVRAVILDKVRREIEI